MVDARRIINLARNGERLTKSERVALGDLADAYWTDLCARCRRRFPCDLLLIEERCPGCLEAASKLGF